jgi:hypothetical protein
MESDLQQQGAIWRERDAEENPLCAEYFVDIWFGFRWLLAKEGLQTVTTKRYTYTYSIMYTSNKKQTKQGQDEK